MARLVPTKLWDVHTALKDLFTEALDIPVIDGPVTGKTTLPKAYVLVGTDGGDTGRGENADEGATSNQVLSNMGPGTWRDETGEITSAAWVWSGNTGFSDLRATAKNILATLESALWADPQLGGLLVKPGFTGFGEVRVREEQGENGAVVRATFTVPYQALITI